MRIWPGKGLMGHLCLGPTQATGCLNQTGLSPIPSWEIHCQGPGHLTNDDLHRRVDRSGPSLATSWPAACSHCSTGTTLQLDIRAL